MALFGRRNPPPGPPGRTGDDTARNPAATGGGFEPAAPTPHSASSGAPQPAPTSSPFPPNPAATNRSLNADKGSEMNTTPSKPILPNAIPGSPLRNEPRRVVDQQPGLRRADGAAPAPVGASDQQRRLIVGRDISLSGEITSCDVLVVEGTVEAKLRDGRSIEITESGLFKGSVEIDEADIGGRFEGDILVRGRLKVRSTGRINGTIKYGELEVEAGGRLVGDIQVVEAAAPAAPAAPAIEAAPIPALSVPASSAD